LRYLLLSDTHSNLEALEACLELARGKYEKMLCLGDVVGYGPQPNEVIERLRELRPTAVLMGNHDDAVITGDAGDFSPHAAKAVDWTRKMVNQESLGYLAKLKPSARLERSEVTLALFHGSPRNPLTEYVYPGSSESVYRNIMQSVATDVVLLGHTHIPMLYEFNGRLIANPGSVGQPRDGDRRASFATLTLSKEASFEVQRVEYDVGSVANRIVQAGLPRFLAERLYMGV